MKLRSRHPGSVVAVLETGHYVLLAPARFLPDVIGNLENGEALEGKLMDGGIGVGQHHGAPVRVSAADVAGLAIYGPEGLRERVEWRGRTLEVMPLEQAAPIIERINRKAGYRS